eukprot:5528851-Lingulodinium_polyedra.AAC.1
MAGWRCAGATETRCHYKEGVIVWCRNARCHFRIVQKRVAIILKKNGANRQQMSVAGQLWATSAIWGLQHTS